MLDCRILLVDRFLQVARAGYRSAQDLLPPRHPSRALLVPEPQSADQLVEVPTVLTPTRIAEQIAEQIVDTPVHLPESVEWVQLRDEATSRPYFWNRRTRETKWKPPPGIRVVWVGQATEGGGIWYWHKGTRASTYVPPSSASWVRSYTASPGRYTNTGRRVVFISLYGPSFLAVTCSLFWYDSGSMTSVYRGFCGWSFLYSAQCLVRQWLRDASWSFSD